MKRARRLTELIRRRGFTYLCYVLWQLLVPRQLGMSLLGPIARRLAAWRSYGKRSTLVKTVTARSPCAQSRHLLRLEQWPVGAETRAVIEAARRQTASDLVLARIDNDGHWLPLLGPLPGLEGIALEAFVERYRFDLDLVLVDEFVLIRKNYRGDRAALLREAAALAALIECPGVPRLFRVDEREQRLYKSFVPGPTLRDVLVWSGADILTKDTANDPSLGDLEGVARIEAVWARGRSHLERSAPGLVARLERLLESIHRLGVTGFSLSFGNVIVGADDTPWLIDFDAATTHRRPRGLLFETLRDRDRELFNRIYGARLITEKRARGMLAGPLATNYAPVDLGRGLHTPGFWSTDSGTGRWQYLNRRIVEPLVEGQRVLDLGAHNGAMSLSMLRSGAREVVAYERDPDMVKAARQLQEVIEWRDKKRYHLDLRLADMLEVLDASLGQFGVVTAFCSLYYLTEQEMVAVTGRLSELSPIFVVQAKTDTRAQAAHDKARKSSVEFLQRILNKGGFPEVEVVSPAGFSRPLLVGRRTLAKGPRSRAAPSADGEAGPRIRAKSTT